MFIYWQGANWDYLDCLNKANNLKVQNQKLDLFSMFLIFVVNLSDMRVLVLTNCIDVTGTDLSDGQ